MESRDLKILYCNGVYGTDGSDLPEWARTHFNHVVRRRQDLILKRADVRHSLELVEAQGRPDIVAIAEVLGEGQRKELIGGLWDMGYEQAHYGQGAAFKGLPGQHDEIVIATRDLVSRSIELTPLNLPNDVHGHGGGLVGISLPDLNAAAFAGHLPLPDKKRRESYGRHVDVLAEAIHGQHAPGRVLLMGDFNLSPERLADRSPHLVRGLELMSPNVPTYDLWPIRVGWNPCLDQIYGRGFTFVDGEAVVCRSDHKAITAVVRTA